MKTTIYKTCCLTVALLAFAPILSADASGDDASDGLYVVYDKQLSPDRAIAYTSVEGKKLPLLMDSCASFWLSLFTPTCQALGVDVLQDEREISYAKVRVALDKEGTLSPPRDALVTDAPNQMPVAGALGWSVLSTKVWDLDHPKQRQAFHKSLPEEMVKGWPSFPIVEVPMGVLAIEVPIDGKKQQVFIDTGSVEGVSLSQTNWKRWRAAAKPKWLTLQATYSPSHKTGFEVSSTAITNQYLLGDLDLGQVRISDMQDSIALTGQAVDIPILLGFNAFRQRRVIIDGPGKKIYFGPLAEPAEQESFPNINRAQATFIPPNLKGGEMTAHVIEGGTAHRAGLRDGDTVLMVDGNLARNWKTDKTVRPSNVFNREPGTRVRLLIERDGERFPITFELGRSPLDPQPEKNE